MQVVGIADDVCLRSGLLHRRPSALLKAGIRQSALGHVTGRKLPIRFNNWSGKVTPPVA
jgi:hypothetical protein